MDVGRRDFQGQSVEVDLSLLVASALYELNDNFGVCLARRKGKEPMLELVECFNPRPVGLRAAFGDAAKSVELIREGMVDLRYEFFSQPCLPQSLVARYVQHLAELRTVQRPEPKEACATPTTAATAIVTVTNAIIPATTAFIPLTP